MGCAGSKTTVREDGARAPSSATEEAVKPRASDEATPVVDVARAGVTETPEETPEETPVTTEDVPAEVDAAEDEPVVDGTYVVSRAMRDDSAREMIENDAAYAETTTEAMNAASKRVRERWVTTAATGAEWRFWTQEETTVSALTESLRGAKVSDVETDLSVMMCAHDALESAVGVWREGEARIVAKPRVFAVDVYLSIDGEAFDDGHVCAGEPDFDRKAAIEAGLDAAGLEGAEEREAARRALEKAREGGAKPWCTLIGSNFSAGNHFVHLPLMAQYLDGAILDPYSKAYAHALMWRWADACKRVGAGEHQVTLRCAPLGIFVPESNACTFIGTIDDARARPEGFKAFLDELRKEYETSPNAPGLSATFSLTLRDEHCKGDKVERQAQEWAADWPTDEIAECYTTAFELANTGAPGEMAAAMVPGAVCCHVVLPSTEGQSGIAEVRNKRGDVIYHEFHAWGLFKGLDGQPEARTGAQIKFRCVQEVNESGEAKGPWIAKDYDPRPCNGLMLKNKHIDLAIKRDDARIKIPGGVN